MVSSVRIVYDLAWRGQMVDVYTKSSLCLHSKKFPSRSEIVLGFTVKVKRVSTIL